MVRPSYHGRTMVQNIQEQNTQKNTLTAGKSNGFLGVFERDERGVESEVTQRQSHSAKTEVKTTLGVRNNEILKILVFCVLGVESECLLSSRVLFVLTLWRHPPRIESTSWGYLT